MTEPLKVTVGELTLSLKPGDGLLMFVWRHEEGRPEVHIPVLGQLAEGRVERHSMLMYRAIARARSDIQGDLEERTAEMKEAAAKEAQRIEAEQALIKART